MYWHECKNGDIFVGSEYEYTGILKWNGTTFVKVYDTGSGWRYWIENPNGIFVSNHYLSGQLKYDPIAKKFIMYRADYTGKPFVGDLTFYSDNNTTGRIYNSVGAAVLENTYPYIRTNGAYACALSVDNTQLLYSKSV